MPYNWTVWQDLSYRSDYHAIQWILFYNAQPINNLTGQCYNTKDTDIKEWTKALEANLNLHYAPLHLLLDKNKTLSTKELDKAASALTRVISLANEQAAKIWRPLAAAKPWWNSELSQIAGEIQSLRDLQLIYLEKHSIQDPDIILELKRLHNFFKRSCQHAKTEWANTTLAEAKTEEIWGFRRWSSGIWSCLMPALNWGPNMPPAISHHEKCNTLCEVLYQLPPPLPEPAIVDLTNWKPDKLPFVDITKTEVYEALFSTSANTPPGPSQINYTMIK